MNGQRTGKLTTAIIRIGLTTQLTVARKISCRLSTRRAIAHLNEALATFGFAIIGFFIVCWLISALVYRWSGYEDAMSTSASH
jgi:high-affinity nickel-transport protein